MPYLLGTVLGTAPGTVALVILGDAVTGRVSPALLAVSVTGGLVGTLGAVVAARRPAGADDEPHACRSSAGDGIRTRTARS